MPLFNWATEIDITNFLSYIDRLNYKLKKTNNIVVKIYILKNKKHDIFFDVGAHKGESIKSFGKNFQINEMYSFEPNNVIFDELRVNSVKYKNLF